MDLALFRLHYTRVSYANQLKTKRNAMRIVNNVQRWIRKCRAPILEDSRKKNRKKERSFCRFRYSIPPARRTVLWKKPDFNWNVFNYRQTFKSTLNVVVVIRDRACVFVTFAYNCLFSRTKNAKCIICLLFLLSTVKAVCGLSRFRLIKYFTFKEQNKK